LIPVRAERLPNHRFRVVVGMPITPRDPSADTEAQIIDMSAQVNAVFEDWIRADPQEWMCLARRWPKEVERRGE
jgi:KDO2-lipid IV(A) lauroyltransferase